MADHIANFEESDIIRMMKMTNPFNYAVIDNFLEMRSVKELRTELLKNEMWKYKNWVAKELYLKRPDGNIFPELAQELKSKFSVLLAPFELVNYWAVLHNQNAGLNAHADNGSIAINIWLTENKFNLQKESGGLTLFDVKRKDFMHIHEFNTQPYSTEYLDRNTKGSKISIEYCCNRAVVFDATTFHASQAINFDNKAPDGCRMNLTLLFDNKQQFLNRLNYYKQNENLVQSEYD